MAAKQDAKKIIRIFFLFLFLDAIITLTACATVSSTKPNLASPPVPNNSQTNPWSHVVTPTRGVPQSLGRYSAGCLKGAQKIELTGFGYQVMRPERARYFGHPLLIQFIKDLATQVRKKGWGDLLVGDMGQPRGGPTVGGHASHQIGLDVDIWFKQETDGKILTTKQRNTVSAPGMVVGDFNGLNKKYWKPQKLDLVKTAAENSNVQRIFVNPVIKRELCKIFKGESWMTKVRPWWFHEEHFHVRLYCAPGDSTCEAQEATPAGDGCDETLDAWFAPESKAKEKQMRESPGRAVLPTLPNSCDQVLQE